MLEGTFLVEQEGKAPVTLKAGGTFLIPAGTIHNATNTGGGRERFSRPTSWRKASRSRRRQIRCSGGPVCPPLPRELV